MQLVQEVLFHHWRNVKLVVGATALTLRQTVNPAISDDNFGQGHIYDDKISYLKAV